MIKFFKNPLVVLFICFSIYYIYSRNTHYFITGSLQTQEVASIATQKKDPSVCQKIRMGFDIMPMNTTEGLQDGCYIKVAKSLKDETICEKVSERYQGLCYLDMASVLGDPSLCKLSDYPGMCYGNVASQTKNVKVCESVENESDRNRCYSDFNKLVGDISICENKVHIIEDKDNCYFSVVLSFFQRDKKLTPSEKLICEKITTKNLKDECIQYYNRSTNTQSTPQ